MLSLSYCAAGPFPASQSCKNYSAALLQEILQHGAVTAHGRLVWVTEESASGWALYWTALLQGKMVFLSPLYFEEDWCSPFPRTSLGNHGVGCNDSHQGERCQTLRTALFYVPVTPHPLALCSPLKSWWLC